jgi:K+-transporting ATPase ATPase A chain
MNTQGWLQLAVFCIVVLALTKPMGIYLHRVLETTRVGHVEQWIHRLCGIDPSREQGWLEYAMSLLAFSAIGVLVNFAIQRLQALLPLNPQHLPAVAPALALNTAVSFVSNTNWQSYAGESTMSYLTQMAALGWQNFTSAAAGLAVAMAVARGLTRQTSETIGNFWVDVVRGTVFVLLPLSAVIALVLVSQGVIQSVAPYRDVVTLEGGRQLLAMGPVASQEAIKMLGTNGGGFFNANSAHPFENPNPLTNFLEMVLIFQVPAGLTYTFGRMAKSQRQGWALFAAMAVLFAAGAVAAPLAESRPNAALAGLGVDQSAGNLEGKETRFGVAGSSLFAVVTTDASCGAVNAMHDSFTPLGGLVTLFDIQLGEVVFGGVGAGLYGMLVMAIVSVFLAGLMVGRTPEYLGKKIEVGEIQLAMLYALVFPIVILALAAMASVSSTGTSALSNPGPHGLSEILYAFTSAAGNNGSSFAGLNANTGFYNLLLTLAMMLGRFWMIVPALAIAGRLACKKKAPAGPGTFPTDGPLFVALLVGVVIIVGALTFLPALSLGPVIEHFAAAAGRTH